MNDPTCEISDEDLTSLLSKSDKIRHTLVFLDVWEFKGSRIEGCKGTNLIYLKILTIEFCIKMASRIDKKTSLLSSWTKFSLSISIWCINFSAQLILYI